MPKIQDEKPDSKKKPPASAGGKKKTEPKTAAPASNGKANGEATSGNSSPKSPTTPTVAPKPALASPTREIRYEKPQVKLAMGEKAITPDLARDILGWQEESENIKFKVDENPAHLQDERGKKVRLNNNLKNRPITVSNYETLKQIILRGHYELNGETIVIGETGMLINGQHRLIALVLADQEWQDKQGQWQEFRKVAPTIDSVIVYGISEKDKVVNTIDTAKPRTFTEVMYRSEFFADVKPRERKGLSRAADYAVRYLWDRTGAGANNFTNRRTHDEALNFIGRHPRLIQCVKHIYEEDSKGAIAKVMSPGLAACLLYLMGSCATEREKEGGKGYSDVSVPFASEKLLDWKHWSKAQDFWVQLAGGNKEFLPIRGAIGKCIDGLGSETCGGNRYERAAIVVKFWNLWSAGEKVTQSAIMPSYSQKKDEDGFLKIDIDEIPIVGGIDIGYTP